MFALLKKMIFKEEKKIPFSTVNGKTNVRLKFFDENYTEKSFQFISSDITKIQLNELTIYRIYNGKNILQINYDTRTETLEDALFLTYQCTDTRLDANKYCSNKIEFDNVSYIRDIEEDNDGLIDMCFITEESPTDTVEIKYMLYHSDVADEEPISILLYVETKDNRSFDIYKSYLLDKTDLDIM